jgi:hypothetical protein
MTLWSRNAAAHDHLSRRGGDIGTQARTSQLVESGPERPTPGMLDGSYLA